jgi:uncharacterized protein with LGFP repeats
MIAARTTRILGIALAFVVGVKVAFAPPPPPDPITEKYRSMGGANSILGNPVAPEQTLSDGRFREYQRGVIYWKEGTGQAQEVHGPILQKWSSVRRQAGFLGYPETDVTAVGDDRGFFTQFNNGVIYWSNQTGAHEVHGAILEKWSSLGRQSGVLGFA